MHCCIARTQPHFPCSKDPSISQETARLSHGMSNHTDRNGGTALAPTPVPSLRMSKEPSKEDIEMAENLSLLNHAPRNEAKPQEESARISPDGSSEIYHSLEDAIPLAQGSQPERPLTPGSTASTAISNANNANVLVTGQVCRCVI